VAELTGFHYRHGSSRFHRLDVRLKLVLLAAGSLVCLRLELIQLGLMLVLALAAFGRCRCLPRFQGRESRWLGVLLAFVFMSRVLSAEGGELLFSGPLAVTREGVAEGLAVTVRLAIVFLLGAAFVNATRSAEIKAGVQWFLRPLPGVPARRVGAMLGLVTRFIPMFLEQAAATSDAQRARAVENRRNPVYRAVKFGIPFMRRIFETADTLTLAMEARCYSDDRTDPALAAGPADWGLFGAAAAVLAALCLMP
jgi:energy-coupling factor transporter transmembrane protein EcfT